VEEFRLASPLPSLTGANDPRGAPCCNRGLSIFWGFFRSSLCGGVRCVRVSVASFEAAEPCRRLLVAPIDQPFLLLQQRSP
jgi:hypothetical protein